jgi:hypothetical protein
MGPRAGRPHRNSTPDRPARSQSDKDLRVRFESLAAVSRGLEYYHKIGHDHRLRDPYHFTVAAFLVVDPITCNVCR